jgi:hypothetical protein
MDMFANRKLRVFPQSAICLSFRSVEPRRVIGQLEATSKFLKDLPNDTYLLRNRLH